MKNFIKNSAACLCLISVILIYFGIGAYAIKIDGALNEHDWNDASVFVLKEQKNFNNKIKSAVVKVLENKQDGFVYLAVMTEFEKDGDINNCKVKIAVNDSEPSVISVCDGVLKNGTYPVEAKSTFDENSSCAFTEASVFFKDGANRSDIIKINIFDMNGAESGTYTIELDDEEASADEDLNTEKTTKKSSSKTTKTKKTTSKKSSSKKTTTKDSFTFKKVDKTKTEIDDEIVDESSERDQSTTTENTQIVYESEEKTSDKKYVYLIIGAVCAAGVAVAAVVAGTKSNKNHN